jgi:hypothetical protein
VLVAGFAGNQHQKRKILGGPQALQTSRVSNVYYSSSGIGMSVVVSSRLVASLLRDKRHKYATLLAILKRKSYDYGTQKTRQSIVERSPHIR